MIRMSLVAVATDVMVCPTSVFIATHAGQMNVHHSGQIVIRAREVLDHPVDPSGEFVLELFMPASDSRQIRRVLAPIGAAHGILRVKSALRPVEM